MVETINNTQMTKYILHGGATRLPSENNNNFFKEIVKDLPNPASILLIYFARDEKDWNDLFSQEEKNFVNADPSKQVYLTLADKNIETLVNDIKNSDAIYIRGGSTPKLIEVMRKINNLAELFKNKTVAGSSAGAYLLAKYWYSKDRDDGKEFGEGLGILPLKVFCHFSQGDESILKRLEQHGENLKIYAIEETKFEVIKA